MYSDKEVLKFFGGLLSLQIIVKLVKQFVKESRPIKTKTYGMPSTRSASMFEPPYSKKNQNPNIQTKFA